jgi:hypothetical protein
MARGLRWVGGRRIERSRVRDTRIASHRYTGADSASFFLAISWEGEAGGGEGIERKPGTEETDLV